MIGLRFGLWLLLGLEVSGIASPCESNPCENGGECVTRPNGNQGYTCICPDAFAGIHCTLPFPKINCGNLSIEILIDQRVVTEQGLQDDTRFVHFKDAATCLSVKRNGQFHLKVDAPFTDCGVKLKRDTGGYLFSQQIVWNKVDEVVERPLVLVDFRCNYTDRYAVMLGPVVPTVTTVDFDTSYGRFTVRMDLHKNRSFTGLTRLNTRPVIAIQQEVCVQQNLVNVMPKDLALTMLRCWASVNRNGSGEYHNLVNNKCVDDPTTVIVANGNESAARFCFKMFKWKQSMDAVYLHCYVSVCNKTAHPEYCSCESRRQKRYAGFDIKARLEEDSTMISSDVIRIVEPGFLDDWLSFLRPGGGANERQYDVDQDGFDTDPIPEHNESNSTVLIVVGVVLVAAVIMLGVVVAVYINCRRSNRRQKRRNTRNNLQPTHSRQSQLPLA